MLLPMQLDMLARLRTTLLLVGAAAIVATAATTTFDAERALASLPDLTGRSEAGRGAAPAIAAMDASRIVRGRFLSRFTEDRLEADLARAPALLRARSGRRAPASLPALRGNRQARALQRALAAIPASELESSVSVRRPRKLFDPWHATIRLDLRDLAGSSPAFSRPPTELELVLRPVGTPGEGVVRRWHVERARFERGGVLGLAPSVAYTRSERIAVASPSDSKELAGTVARELSGMLPRLERDYPGLRIDGRGVFVVLAPTSAAAGKALSVLGPRDLARVSGIAAGGHHIALDLPELRSMAGFERRALLRHELAHIATYRLTMTAGDLYAEGLAEWEGDHEIVRSGSYFMVNGGAVDWVESGRIDLDRVLFTAVDFDALPGERWRYYRLGSIAVDYMERTHGHGRTVRFYRQLADGSSHRVAVRRAFGMRPDAFRRAVAAWASSHRTWHG